MLEALRELIFNHIIDAQWYGWKEILQVLFTSMVPVLELRGAIAFGRCTKCPGCSHM